MGHLSAMDMAAQPISREAALHWHLTSNHFPPVSTEFIPTCIAAIDAANDGDWDRVIDFPEGAQIERDNAGRIIDGLHLESFVDFSDNGDF